MFDPAMVAQAAIAGKVCVIAFISMLASTALAVFFQTGRNPDPLADSFGVLCVISVIVTAVALVVAIGSLIWGL